MKQVITILILFLHVSCEKDTTYPESFYACSGTISDNPAYPKAEALQIIIDEMAASGVPGVMLTVHDSVNGYWSGAAGYADLASKVKMQPCQLTRVGSTVKTFTAVSLFLLQEDEKLDLDDPVNEYLTADVLRGLQNADKCTIRQLMQHSSGIYNYIQNLKFQTASLNDLPKTWTPDELLAYARGKDAYFKPGTDVMYSNTNYVLLGMIIEKVTGMPYDEFFEERIFTPLGLDFTACASADPVPEGIVRGYVDFYSKMDLINSTYFSGWDYYTADGGLISNAYDLNRFMTGLFSGEILSGSSLAEMLSWQTPKEEYGEGFQTDYGLGIFKILTDHGPAYIHSGDAIGYYATMVYFPEQKITISWAVNGNYGKLDDLSQSKAAMERVFGGRL
jgi:D-alanyl-D-alanine carboxypeptidase